MASSFSASLGLENPNPGEQNNVWGTTENTGRNLVDTAVAGIETVAVTGSNTALTFVNGAADTSRFAHFVATGTITTGVSILWPNGKTRVFSLQNNTTGSFPLSIGVTGGTGVAGGTVTVPQGFGMQLVSDGTNVTQRGTAMSGVSISSGTIDGVIIGGTAPAAGNFTTLTTTSAVAGVLPVGMIAPYGGISTAPSGWALCFGQPLSRSGATGFPALFGAIAVSTSGLLTSGSAVIPGISGTTGVGMAIGMPVSGTGIPANTTIASIQSNAQITLSTGVTTGTGGAVSFVVAPYGVGDGSTTFNLPDFRGRVLAGLDSMGGTAANRLGAGNSGGFAATTIIGAAAGEQSHALIIAEMPSHNHSISYNDISGFIGSGASIYNTTPSTFGITDVNLNIQPAGGGGAHNNVQPTVVVNYIIKTT